MVIATSIAFEREKHHWRPEDEDGSEFWVF
jgi:hypothetical protein